MSGGPAVRRLVATVLGHDAVPPGGGFKDAIEYLMAPDLGSRIKAAQEWVEAAIAAVKAAPDNPYGLDDEAVAVEILRRIESRV